MIVGSKNGVPGHIGGIGYCACTSCAHVAVGASATDNPLICKSSRRGDAERRIRVTKKTLITTLTKNGRGLMYHQEGVHYSQPLTQESL